MHLQLSPEEFQRLLQLAYLGEAVMNDWTPADALTEDQRAATDLLYDLCARASQTPSAPMVEFEEETGEWLPSEQLREEMNAVLGNYDNDVFWDELVHRLSHRELVAEYGQDALAQMSDRYRQQAANPLLEYYWHEVRNHGIDHLQVRDQEPAIEQSPKPRQRKGRSKTK